MLYKCVNYNIGPQVVWTKHLKAVHDVKPSERTELDLMSTVLIASYHWWAPSRIGQCSVKLFILRLTIETENRKTAGSVKHTAIINDTFDADGGCGLTAATHWDVHTDWSFWRDNGYFYSFVKIQALHTSLYLYFFLATPAAIWNY